MSDCQRKEYQEEETGRTEYPYMVSVKFRNAGRAYSFGTDDATLKMGDQVVVETAQGMELGECEAAAISTTMFKAPSPLKPVLRLADEQDKAIYAENFEMADEAYKTCNALIKEMGLKMRLLSADYTLDRSKVLFVYLADQRVDFRELLKKLGSELHCRIELRQIGERDKAKMVGGIGMCGMECCCSRFKNHFDVISISMAKTQLLALNVEKLSGQCGKLMCCLKYENEDYKKMTDGLPKMGAHVEYDGAMYRVTSMNVMNNEARIENSETVQTISIEDLRDKCVVRKGVAMAKRQPGRGGKRTVINNVNQEAPRKVEDKLHETLHRQVKEQQDNGANPVSYAAQAAFVGHEASTGNLSNGDQPATGGTSNNPQNRNRNNRNRNRNRNNNQNRNNNNNRNRNRDNHGGHSDSQKHLSPSKNNPNMTVRSFKSSKSKEPAQGK
jgi:cell fate regulator YaaT (PSP1 superfamily)